MEKMMVAMSIAQGNPGALQGVMEMLQGDPKLTISISLRLKECPTIVGTNFYVLYSDLCGKDIEKMSQLCNSDITNEVLEDACNRQDYSGRELVKEFI